MERKRQERKGEEKFKEERLRMWESETKRVRERRKKMKQ